MKKSRFFRFLSILRRFFQACVELQQKGDDTKKMHKLEITAVKSTLSDNTEEIYRLKNHNKTLIGKIRKLKGTKKTKQSSPDTKVKTTK